MPLPPQSNRCVQTSRSVNVHVSGGQKCERCWHYTEDVGTVAEHATVCARCADNIDGQGEARNYV